jgi:hypothetical protein
LKPEKRILEELKEKEFFVKKKTLKIKFLMEIDLIQL